MPTSGYLLHLHSYISPVVNKYIFLRCDRCFGVLLFIHLFTYFSKVTQVVLSTFYTELTYFSKLLKPRFLCLYYVQSVHSAVHLISILFNIIHTL